MRKILVINGPNLNFLGIREPSIYGHQTYNDLTKMIIDYGNEHKIEIECFQSNHEGGIIDKIQEAYLQEVDGLIINPGAYTHYSYAIHDALESVRTFPKIEVHISDINARESFRKISVTHSACDGQIAGQGLQGYLMAVDRILDMIKEKNEEVTV